MTRDTGRVGSVFGKLQLRNWRSKTKQDVSVWRNLWYFDLKLLPILPLNGQSCTASDIDELDENTPDLNGTGQVKQESFNSFGTDIYENGKSSFD